MDPAHDDLVAQFSAITGTNPSSAQATLASANWNLQEAVSLHYAAQEDDNEEEDDSYNPADEAAQAPAAAPDSRPPQASASSSRKATTQRPKQMTLDDLKKIQESHAEDDDDDDKDQNLFAGGEKSGLAVQNPGQNSSGGPVDHFRNIMNQARANRDRPPAAGEEPQAPARSSNFSGRAQTLGGDDAESQIIEDPNQAATQPQQAQRVNRTLHLWADGVSIDDGPLFRFDDPNNQHMMAEINRGRAPMALLDVRPDQEVDLNLDPHKGENYVAPKKKYKPFGGQGQRLGSPTPGSGASSAEASMAIPQGSTSSSSTTNTADQTPQTEIDESAPTVQLQIRLGDGTQLRSRFNTTHTIGDVYSFVNSASASSSQRPYALMTTFPSKELSDKAAVLGDLAEFKRGGVVVQKWK